jgi:hypothetical protein
LKNIQENEEENIDKFWNQEIKKCLFVVEQRERKKEEFNNKKMEDEKKKAIAEAQKEVSNEVLEQRELARLGGCILGHAA